MSSLAGEGQNEQRLKRAQQLSSTGLLNAEVGNINLSKEPGEHSHVFFAPYLFSCAIILLDRLPFLHPLAS